MKKCEICDYLTIYKLIINIYCENNKHYIINDVVLIVFYLFILYFNIKLTISFCILFTMNIIYILVLLLSHISAINYKHKFKILKYLLKFYL